MNNFEHNMLVVIEELSEVSTELSRLQSYLLAPLNPNNPGIDPLSQFNGDQLHGEICDFVGAIELIHEQMPVKIRDRIGLIIGNEFIVDGFINKQKLELLRTEPTETVDKCDHIVIALVAIQEIKILGDRLQQRFAKTGRFGILDGYSKEDGTNAMHIRDLTTEYLSKLTLLSQAIPVFNSDFMSSQRTIDKKARVEHWKVQAKKNGTLAEEDIQLHQVGRDLSV